MLAEFGFGDTGSGVNLMRSATGCGALAVRAVGQTLNGVNIKNVNLPLHRARQIALGAVCLRLGFKDLYNHICGHAALLDCVDFFESLSDPDYYAAQNLAHVAPAESAALFMQGFYNLVANTGHVITPEHMRALKAVLPLVGDAEDIAAVDGDAIAPPQFWRLRLQNRRVIKQACALLAQDFHARPFRVFQQDYDGEGVLAVNATAYRDFDAPACRFVLDCRLETDMATQTASVTSVLFSRDDRPRFVETFGGNDMLAGRGFVFKPNTPNGPCWLKQRAEIFAAEDAKGLVWAVADEIKFENIAHYIF